MYYSDNNDNNNFNQNNMNDNYGYNNYNHNNTRFHNNGGFCDMNNQNNYQAYSAYGLMPPTPRQIEASQIRKNANLLGITIILFFIGIQISSAFLFYISPIIFPNIYIDNNGIHPNMFQTQFLNLIQYTGVMTIPFFLYMLMINIPARVAIPFKKPKLSIALHAIPITLALSAVSLIATSAITIVLSFFHMQPTMPDVVFPTDFLSKILFVINLAVLPAIFEEIAFRGIIMQSLRRFGDGFAILISSILFSLIHGNLIQAPNAFFMGLCIGYFVVRTGSIFTGMIIHFANNFIAIIVDFLTLDLSIQNKSAVVIGLYIFYIIAGIISVILLSKKHPDMFMIKKKHTVLTLSEKSKVFFTSFAMAIALLIIIFSTLKYIRII